MPVVIKEYVPEEILPLIRNSYKENSHIYLEGPLLTPWGLTKTNETQKYKVKNASLKLVTFKRYGLTCIECGLVGSLFRLEEVNKQPGKYCLNLYHKRISRAGNPILTLMTHDHKLARCLGGSAKSINNVQTMCVYCNGKKGGLEEQIYALKLPKEWLIWVKGSYKYVRK